MARVSEQRPERQSKRHIERHGEAEGEPEGGRHHHRQHARRTARIATVVGELADLGRRIERRARELASLAEGCHRTTAAAAADTIAAAAADLAGGIAGGFADDPASGFASDTASGFADCPAVGFANGRPTRPDGAPMPAATPPGALSTAPAHRSADAHPRLPEEHRPRDRSVAIEPADRAPRGAKPPETPCGGRAKPRSAAARPHRGGQTLPGRDTSEPTRRLRTAAPLLMSTVVHVVALASIACMYIAVKADRLPIVLDMSAAPGPEELAAIDISAASGDAEPVAAEPLAAWDAIAAETPIVEPLASTTDEPFATDSLAAAVAAIDPADMLAEVAGIAAGSGVDHGRGGGARAGGPRAGGAPAGGDLTTFFGREGSGRSVCFLCDNSNSHRDGGFHAVLDEVARAVDALRPEQSFFVVFFSDAAYPLFHPASVDRAQPATPENKRRLRAWLGTVEMCSGGQGIHDAVRLAGAAGTDVVYLLSDGEFSGSVVDRVQSADIGDTVVHTLGIQQTVVDRRTGLVVPDRLREQEGFNRNLAAIATAHGGTFTPVAIPPLAAALERTRPIPRNRSRGPVWGMKL